MKRIQLIIIFGGLYFLGLNDFVIAQQSIVYSDIAKSKLLESANANQVTILAARLNNLRVKLGSMNTHLSFLEKQSMSDVNIAALKSLEEEYADLNKGFIEEKGFAHEKKINQNAVISKKISFIEKQMSDLKLSLAALSKKKKDEKIKALVPESVKENIKPNVRNKKEKDILHKISLAKAHKSSLIREVEVMQKDIDRVREKIRVVQVAKGVDQEVALAGLEQQMLLLQPKSIYLQELVRRYHMEKDSSVASKIEKITNEIKSLNEEYGSKREQIKNIKIMSKDAAKAIEKNRKNRFELIKKQKIQSVMSHVISVLNDLESIDKDMMPINSIVGKERQISLASIALRIEKMKLDAVALDSVLMNEKLNKDITLMQNIDFMKKKIENLEKQYVSLKEGENVSSEKKKIKYLQEVQKPSSLKVATLSDSVREKKKVLAKKAPQKKQVGEKCNKNEECDSKLIKSSGGADIHLVCYGWHCAYECQYDAASHNHDKNKKCPKDWICNKPPIGYINGFCSKGDLPEGSTCYSSGMCKKGLRCFNKDGECDVANAGDKSSACSGKCSSGAVYGGPCNPSGTQCQKGLACVELKAKKCETVDGPGGRASEKCEEAVYKCLKNKTAATQDC